MPYELTMRLGQPFDVLIGDKIVTLPWDGKIRVQFADRESADRAYTWLAMHTEIRPCRDEAEGGAVVVQGTVIKGELEP